MKYLKEFKLFEILDSNSLDNMIDYIQDIFDKYDIVRYKGLTNEKPQYKYWAEYAILQKYCGINIENLTWSEQRDIHDYLKGIKDSLERFIGMKINFYPESNYSNFDRVYSIKIRIIKKLERWE